MRSDGWRWPRGEPWRHLRSHGAACRLSCQRGLLAVEEKRRSEDEDTGPARGLDSEQLDGSGGSPAVRGRRLYTGRRPSGAEGVRHRPNTTTHSASASMARHSPTAAIALAYCDSARFSRPFKTMKAIHPTLCPFPCPRHHLPFPRVLCPHMHLRCLPDPGPHALYALIIANTHSHDL